tara:strand:+ start:1325 stop:1738 length:414 start_codon:yes stop_codon:yes gene_type:complete
MENDKEIFTGKTFSSLVKDIYFNSSNKKDQINQLILDLNKMVKDAGSATVIAPMIKDYLDIGIKNDDQLVKLSAVLQRYISGSNSGDEKSSNGILSEEEKQQLMSSVKKEINTISKEDSNINKEITSIKDKFISDGS